MSKLAGLAGGQTLGIASVAVAGVTAAGLYLGGVFLPEPSVEPVVLIEPEAPDAQPVETQEPATAVVVEDVEDVEAIVQPVVLPDPPSIDVFRLESDGMMLVAGSTTKGWVTTLVMDNESIAQVEVDTNGQFFQFVDIGISDKPRILTLVMASSETGDEIASRDQVIIAPTPTVLAETVVAAPDDIATVDETSEPDTAPETVISEAPVVTEPDTVAEAEETAGVTETMVIAEPSETIEEVGNAEVPPVEQTDEIAETATEDEEPQQEQVATQTVLLSNESGVTVLQKPESGGDGPEVMSTVALDVISYSDEGEVQLAGRGAGEGFVRVYLDNSPITTSRIAEDGNWRTELPEVDTGVYTLRIDEVDTEGNVTGRVETPFKREDEDVVASAEEAAGTEASVRAITVQPGNTLWAISRDAYGEGTLYVRVFEANSEHIRDPDLIYPGQVFTLPE